SSIGLGELVAATFLGFATTILPFIVQGYPITFEVIMVAIPFALLISVMILTNNIRDIDKDNEFRKTIAIRLGRARSINLLILILAVLYIWMIVLVFFNIIPAISLISLLALPVVFQLLSSFKGGTTDPSC